MAKTSAELLMEREMRTVYGPVPRRLLGAGPREMHWQVRGEEFLLRAEGNLYFYYRRGSGITIDRGGAADSSEESLWLNGSVYAAIASLNGLVPIHASAVAYDGSVFAFTGPPGGGKSTLVAALGGRGLPMFCDDTLVLDLSEPSRILCLPGHKRLKLTADALAMSGAECEEKVSQTVEKHYATPAAGIVTTTLPLAELIFLTEGDEPAIRPIVGLERLTRMQDDHYTARIHAHAREFARREHFEHLVELANRVTMFTFERPFDPARFDSMLDIVVTHIIAESQRSIGENI